MATALFKTQRADPGLDEILCVLIVFLLLLCEIGELSPREEPEQALAIPNPLGNG
jgi:hypothetical protein